MDKVTRNSVFGIGVALTLVCGYFAIYAFFCAILDEDPESWGIFLGSVVGFGVGCFYFFVCFPPRIATILHNFITYVVQALRSGGKQILCDIIKWTIIIIIAAIVFTIAYRIAISSSNGPVGYIAPY
jgi:hypothetical protein